MNDVDAKNLAGAIAEAVANPPKFYAGDRVRVSGRVREFSEGTIVGGPETSHLGGVRHPVYHVRMDYGRFKSEPPDVVAESALTRLDVCPCGDGCTAVEGVEHERS